MSLLKSLFASRRDAGYVYERHPLGPEYAWLSPERVRIGSGALAGREFTLTTEIKDGEAHFRAMDGSDELGHADVERGAPEAGVVLWFVTVREDLRQKGLASILVRVALRQMLKLHGSSSYAIRMLRLIEPNEQITKIRNVGIAVLSRRLGMDSEFDLEALLRQGNVQTIELIAADGPTPPGYRIVIKTVPYVLIAFLTDPVTGRPFPDGHRIYNSLVSPESAMRWVQDRMIVIGNGNYVLRRDGINEMVNHLADNETEAREFIRRVRPV
jgi:hypothetical protein